ncbi:MerR family transcriptional regulator [Microlunatus ginsengisoli]|uniref:HTH merR-type domain-containing protein n=1 Tax=Microlunatus ginsengisoli TaxID=363863 RepID=A0ABP7AKC3_9ACTN
MTTDPTAAGQPDPQASGQPSADQGVYGIGVTSDLVGTAIQNLRAYERAGLVMPSRTTGGNRLYSPHDVARLRRIQVLLKQGLNLAGIAQVLDLQDDNQRLRSQIDSITEADPPTAGENPPHP